jgi:hypothetical protein
MGCPLTRIFNVMISKKNIAVQQCLYRIVAFRWDSHNRIGELQMDKKFKSNIKVKIEEKRKETEEPIYLLRF